VDNGTGIRGRPTVDRRTRVPDSALTLSALLVVAGVAASGLSGAAPAAGAATQQCRIDAGRADASCTPGAFDPDVTQSTIDQTICVSGWTATVRPPCGPSVGGRC
jgi:hypothetical protein